MSFFDYKVLWQSSEIDASDSIALNMSLFIILYGIYFTFYLKGFDICDKLYYLMLEG